jgi:hypothetical protein
MMSRDPADATGTEPEPTRDEVRRYVTVVDSLLLDVPWRQRRELVRDLEQHISDNPAQIREEPPGEYADALRANLNTSSGGLFFGLRSVSWPTPVEWWESVIRGTAVILLLAVVFDFLSNASQTIVGEPTSTSWPAMIDSSLRSVYPTPTFGGSHRTGLLIFAPVSIIVGQLITAAVLQGDSVRRRRLRSFTYVGAALILGLLGYGALREIW